jgi:hypothetical protein
VIKLYTFAVNRPEFLRYQHATFSKFFKEEFQLVVMNDGQEKSQEISDIAKELKLECHKIVNPRRDTANYAHARSIEFTYENFIKHDTDISAMFDGDMFLARPFSMREWMGDAGLAALSQGRGHVTYMWPGIAFMNMATLPDKETLSYWPDIVEGEGVDVGGHSYLYIKAHPEVKVKWMTYTGQVMERNQNLTALPAELIPSYNSDFHIEIYINAFVHYGAGTNWYHKTPEFHQAKTKFLFNMLDKCMSGEVALPVI